jgi:hypothetical protein
MCLMNIADLSSFLGTESYGGKPLFYGTVEAGNQCVRYRLSKSASSNISDYHESTRLGRVRTVDGVLASVPLEVGLDHFLTGHDPRVASLYLSQASDHVNDGVLEHPTETFGCACDDVTCHQRNHFCQSCLHERLCASLLKHMGARLCKRCHIKRTSSDIPEKSVPEAVMAKSLQRNHKTECRLLDKDMHSPEEKKRYIAMVAVFKKHYRPNNVWFDDYITDERGLASVTGVRASRDPLVNSVDAREPYGQSEDLTMRVHTAMNIAMSTSGYNYAKQRQVIGFLQELAEYEQLGTPHTEEQRAAFMKLCTDFYIVTMKTPWTKKARLQGQDPGDLLADQAEWRAGRPTSEAGPWNLALYRWNLRSSSANPSGSTSSNSWDSEAEQGLSGLVKQIEQRFNKELEKNADGSPKLFKSWRDWNTAMEQRLVRMTIFCNRHGYSKCLPSL